MAARQLDPTSVDPALMRDLQRCCSSCDSKQLCAHELEDKPKGASWPKYCPNEETIILSERGDNRCPRDQTDISRVARVVAAFAVVVIALARIAPDVRVLCGVYGDGIGVFKT
jgi:hypothetical protein